MRPNAIANFLTELWWRLKYGRDWSEERRRMSHPRLGELRFSGRRMRPREPAYGSWEVRPPGFDSTLLVEFQPGNGDPSPARLVELEVLLGDLDALFERCRARAEQAYAQMVEESMPRDWRSAFRLEQISLPDPDERPPEWQVMYWCDAALHWLVVTFRGDEVIDADFQG